MEVVNSEDNDIRSFIDYIGYNMSYIGYIATKSNGGIKNEIKWLITNVNGWCRSYPFQCLLECFYLTMNSTNKAKSNGTTWLPSQRWMPTNGHSYNSKIKQFNMLNINIKMLIT